MNLHHNIETKLESILPVPQGGPSEWASHIVDKAAGWGTIPNPIEVLDDKIPSLPSIVTPTVIESTITETVTPVVESTPLTFHNRFEVLEKINI